MDVTAYLGSSKNCGYCEVAGGRKFCGRDLSDAPAMLRWHARMAQVLSDELKIDSERLRFTVKTGCFNRPAEGVVEILGWTAEERGQVREALTKLVRRGQCDEEDPNYDREIAKFCLRCCISLAGD